MMRKPEIIGQDDATLFLTTLGTRNKDDAQGRPYGKRPPLPWGANVKFPSSFKADLTEKGHPFPEIRNSQ
jgi:hypothetical protein